MTKRIKKLSYGSGYYTPDERLRATSVAELRRRISRLSTVDLSALSDDQIKERLGLIIDAYRTNVVQADMNGLYRARRNDGTRLFEHVRELWYPPPAVINRRGRFNEIGESVFYGCSTPNGALFEIRPQVGDYLTLAVVRAKEPVASLQLAHIGLERSLAPELGLDEKQRIPRNHPGFQAALKADGISTKWLMIDEFLSDMATKVFAAPVEQDGYRLTNAISRLLMRIPGVEGMNYPSVATNMRNLNVSLLPAVADDKFKVEETWLVRIEAAADRLPGASGDGPFYATRFLRRSARILPDGTIEWTDELKNVSPADIAHLIFRTRRGRT